MRKEKKENRSQQAVTMAIVVLIAFFVLTRILLSEQDAKDGRGSDGFDAYKVIVTKNLFRHLGWTKKRSSPSYALVGTIIAVDSGNSKALISDKNTKKTHYVAVGDKIGHATVEKITSKKVALRQPNGSLLELKLRPMQFLNVSKRNSYQRQPSQLKARTATQAQKSGEPKSRTHQIEGRNITFGHSVSREEAARIYDRVSRSRRWSSP